MSGLSFSLGTGFNAGRGPRFNPLDLFDSGEDGLLFDSFDAYTDTAGTTPSGSTDPIARLVDESPNGHVFEQATAGSRPTLQSGGILFDGTDDWLGCADLIAGTALTVAAVTTPTGSTKALLNVIPTTSDRFGVRDDSGQTGIGWHNGTAYVHNTRGLASGKRYFVGQIEKNVSESIRVNGTAGSGTTTQLTTNTVGATIGASSSGSLWHYAGTMHFLLFINRLLTAGELASLEAYLASK